MDTNTYLFFPTFLPESEATCWSVLNFFCFCTVLKFVRFLNRSKPSLGGKLFVSKMKFQNFKNHEDTDWQLQSQVFRLCGVCEEAPWMRGEMCKKKNSALKSSAQSAWAV